MRPNQSVELTATRRIFASQMNKTVSAQATLALASAVLRLVYAGGSVPSR
jgi:hypothetical protein